jgi:hypothetical protein
MLNRFQLVANQERLNQAGHITGNWLNPRLCRHYQYVFQPAKTNLDQYQTPLRDRQE